MPEQVPYLEAVLQFDRLRDEILRTREAITLTSDTHESISVIPTTDLEQLLETVYLFGCQANASRLIDALQSAVAKINPPTTVEALRQEMGLAVDVKLSA
jgi:antitoxin YefM